MLLKIKTLIHYKCCNNNTLNNEICKIVKHNYNKFLSMICTTKNRMHGVTNRNGKSGSLRLHTRLNFK